MQCGCKARLFFWICLYKLSRLREIPGLFVACPLPSPGEATVAATILRDPIRSFLFSDIVNKREVIYKIVFSFILSISDNKSQKNKSVFLFKYLMKGLFQSES